MAGYRPIYKSIWRDPDFQDLNSEDKLVFLYLCTNESVTESGIYPITPKTIGHDTGIEIQKIADKLSNGFHKNIIFDIENRFIFIKKLRKYSTGGRPDLIEKSILAEYKLFPDTELWDYFVEEYPEYKGLINGCPTVGQPSDTIRYVIDKDKVTVTNNNTNGTKNKSDVDIPEWIEEKTWNDFLDFRKKIRKPATDRAQELLVKKLSDLKTEGNDPNKVLEQSIVNGWQGVFPLRNNGDRYGENRGNNKPTRSQPEVYTRPEDI